MNDDRFADGTPATGGVLDGRVGTRRPDERHGDKPDPDEFYERYRPIRPKHLQRMLNAADLDGRVHAIRLN